MKKYDCFILKKDLNPLIKEGAIGVILIIYSDNDFEVEFVKEDGTNYSYNGSVTFTISKELIELINQ